VEGIDLRAYANPQSTIEADTLSVSVYTGATPQWEVAAGNAGGLPAPYSARTEACDGAPAPWLTVDPDTGAVWPGGLSFHVRVDGTLLPEGAYCGRVIFLSPAAALPETLVVDVTILADPTGAPDVAGLPRTFALGAPRPNPSRGQVEMFLDLPRSAAVKVEVLSISGRRVATLAHGLMPAGRNKVRWDGREGAGTRAAAGVYLVRATTADRRSVRKVTLLD
jgi:hypothetical protein